MPFQLLCSLWPFQLLIHSKLEPHAAVWSQQTVNRFVFCFYNSNKWQTKHLRAKKYNGIVSICSITFYRMLPVSCFWCQEWLFNLLEFRSMEDRCLLLSVELPSWVRIKDRSVSIGKEEFPHSPIQRSSLYSPLMGSTGNEVFAHNSQSLLRMQLQTSFWNMVSDLDRHASCFEVTTQNAVASVTFGELKSRHPLRWPHTQKQAARSLKRRHGRVGLSRCL